MPLVAVVCEATCSDEHHSLRCIDARLTERAMSGTLVVILTLCYVNSYSLSPIMLQVTYCHSHIHYIHEADMVLATALAMEVRC
jgi:hypothetical protein